MTCSKTHSESALRICDFFSSCMFPLAHQKVQVPTSGNVPLAQSCDVRNYDHGAFPMPSALVQAAAVCLRQRLQPWKAAGWPHTHSRSPFPSSSHFSSEREKLIENVSEQSHSRGGFSLFAAGGRQAGMRVPAKRGSCQSLGEIIEHRQAQGGCCAQAVLSLEFT